MNNSVLQSSIDRVTIEYYNTLLKFIEVIRKSIGARVAFLLVGKTYGTTIDISKTDNNLTDIVNGCYHLSEAFLKIVTRHAEPTWSGQTKLCSLSVHHDVNRTVPKSCIIEDISTLQFLTCQYVNNLRLLIALMFAHLEKYNYDYINTWKLSAWFVINAVQPVKSYPALEDPLTQLIKLEKQLEEFYSVLISINKVNKISKILESSSDYVTANDVLNEIRKITSEIKQDTIPSFATKIKNDMSDFVEWTDKHD